MGRATATALGLTATVGFILASSSAQAEETKTGRDFISRDGMLAASITVNAATSSAFIYQLAAGEKNLTLDALTLVVNIPVTLYAAAYWAKDPDDLAMAGTVLVGAAITVRGAINVVRNSHRVDAPPGIYWTPVASAHGAGLGMSGTF